MLPHLYNALALIQDTPETTGDQPSMLFPLLAMGAIFYFVLIAPERKTRKKREGMLTAIKKGDRVMTTGGIFGTVRKVEESKIHVMVDDKVCLTFSRTAVQGIVDKEGELLDAKKAPVKDGEKNSSKKDGERPEQPSDESPKVLQEK
jgi:preprotein translocase subunit YajC